MLACSRFRIASATSLAGLFRAAEHCCIVSSPTRRAAQSAGAFGKADLITASARAGSIFCCASAGVAASARMTASVIRMDVSFLLRMILSENRYPLFGIMRYRFRPGTAISPPSACRVRKEISATVASDPSSISGRRICQ